MKLDFFKMQAQGNDYIYFDLLHQPALDIDYPNLSRRLSDRHFGIGADGIVLINKSKKNDAKMRIFNADGSEGRMCGSALRCVTSFLAKNSAKSEFNIDTISGMKKGYVLNNQKDQIKVNLGIPHFIQPDKITAAGYEGFLVNIGNDHFVTFVTEFCDDIARKSGPEIQSDPHFPDSINVDFVHLKSSSEIEIKFWERGSGETLACGSGTAAAVFTGIKKYDLSAQVDVIVPGGKLQVEYLDENIFLSGKVNYVFSGFIET